MKFTHTDGTAAHRTRVKICGLTRESDVDAAVQAGADAVGFVLYASSPRYVTPARAAQLARRLPPFVMPVLLFVNASVQEITQGCQAVPCALLQFHGDETPAHCAAPDRPYLRAARIPLGEAAQSFDLLQYADQFLAAQALLLDAHVSGYGGSGQSFDWSAFDWAHPRLRGRLILSGGLTPANVGQGIARVRPWGVDVSSGVEVSRGIKDPEKIRAFMAAVRAADAGLDPLLA